MVDDNSYLKNFVPFHGLLLFIVVIVINNSLLFKYEGRYEERIVKLSNF